MTPARFGVLALLISGCATMTVGRRMEASVQDSTLLDLCVFSDDSDTGTRNTVHAVMAIATAQAAYAHAKPLFRSATFVQGLEDVRDCDVAMKVKLARIAYAMRPVELYSAYTRKPLVRYEGHARGGAGGMVEIAAQKLRVGGGLYEQIAGEAGPKRFPPSAAVPTPAFAASPSVTKEDLRQLMAEAVKAVAPAAQPQPAVAAISSDVDTPGYKVAERADDYAVVVGVEKYADLPAAQYAERDAKAVYEHLLALGYPQRNIAMLSGTQATKTGLIKNLEAWLPQNVGEKSTVFFYYSGHGAPDPVSGAAYLVPADGDPQYLDETSYPVKRLYEKLQALKAKRVIVAMDSCFSGSGGRSVLAKGTRPLVGKIELGASTGKVASLTASASNQISGVIEAQGHGAFTYYLLRGLNGEAKNASGAVTLKSLHGYLAPRVQDAAKRANRDQTPQLLLGDTAGDSVLR